MKKPSVSKMDNRSNLVLVSKILEETDHFIFYGTLLGLTRESDVIEGDDDIDILVPIENRKLILEKINSINIFRINYEKKCNKFEYFLQVDSSINDRKSIIDFYFYESNPDDDFIVDRWNFLAKSENPECALHIPKKLVFPTLQEEFFGQKIKLPLSRELLCEWLYGQDWKTPQTKNVSYVTRVINNRPKLVKPIPRSVERFIPKLFRPLVERYIN